MPQCLVIPLYLCAGKVSAVRGADGELMPVTLPLPPMCLPQSLLPDSARFAGIGRYKEDDAYLFVVEQEAPGECVTVEEALTASGPLAPLVRLVLEHSDAQDFSLTEERGQWRFSSCDLDREVYS